MARVISKTQVSDPGPFGPLVSIFFLLRIIIYKSKTIIISFKKEVIITPLYKKLTKLSTNDFKTDIKGISNRLEMCKNSRYIST